MNNDWRSMNNEDESVWLCKTLNWGEMKHQLCWLPIEDVDDGGESESVMMIDELAEGWRLRIWRWVNYLFWVSSFLLERSFCYWICDWFSGVLWWRICINLWRFQAVEWWLMMMKMKIKEMVWRTMMKIEWRIWKNDDVSRRSESMMKCEEGGGRRWMNREMVERAPELWRESII